MCCAQSVEVKSENKTKGICCILLSIHVLSRIIGEMVEDTNLEVSAESGFTFVRHHAPRDLLHGN